MPLRPDEQAREVGLSSDRRGERLRLLCDGYGLDAAGAASLLDVVAHRNRIGYEMHRAAGEPQRLPGWREMWDAGSGDEILAPRRMVRGASRRPATIPRVSLPPITVVVTASGAPGTAALLRGLRENGEREVRLVGTDMSERSVGRHLCDAFHLVPAGSDPGFAAAIRAIVEREGADCVLPQSSFDLEGLAEHRDAFPVPVLVSKPGRDLPLERQGRDVRVPAPARAARRLRSGG